MNIHLRIQSLFNDKLQNPYFLFLCSHTHLGKCPSSIMVFEITVSVWVHLSKSDPKSRDTRRYAIKSSNNKSIQIRSWVKQLNFLKCIIEQDKTTVPQETGQSAFFQILLNRLLDIVRKLWWLFSYPFYSSWSIYQQSSFSDTDWRTFLNIVIYF